LVLLELKGLEEVNKDSSLVTSSIMVVKLISVERKRGWIQPFLMLFILLAVFSGFNFLLSALISLKRKAKDFFLGPALDSKQDLLFSAVYIWQLLCNQPCCGCSCHNSDTTCWTPYDS
jgi:hypothetical protein